MNEPTVASRYRDLPVFMRILVACVLAGVFVLLLYPYGTTFTPEANWFRGPLWLFGTQSLTDKSIAAAASAILLSMLFSFAVWQNWITAIVAITGAFLWIGFGFYLAILAAA